MPEHAVDDVLQDVNLRLLELQKSPAATIDRTHAFACRMTRNRSADWHREQTRQAARRFGLEHEVESARHEATTLIRGEDGSSLKADHLEQAMLSMLRKDLKLDVMGSLDTDGLLHHIERMLRASAIDRDRAAFWAMRLVKAFPRSARRARLQPILDAAGRSYDAFKRAASRVRPIIAAELVRQALGG